MIQINPDTGGLIATVGTINVNGTPLSISDLSFQPSPAVWDLVESDGGNCLGRKCANYTQCFYFKARRQVHQLKQLRARLLTGRVDILIPIDHVDVDGQLVLPRRKFFRHLDIRLNVQIACRTTARIGQADASSVDPANSACVVCAPMRIVPPVVLMPFSAAMRPMSTSAGDVIRS